MQIIVPHTNTDLDALGAAVGAQVLYPKAVILLPGPPNPRTGEFISLHRYNLRVCNPRDIDLKSVTRAIVVDTADPARLGPLQEAASRAEVHLFDHHPPEPSDLQGSLEVRDLVGATCTLLAELIEESGARITPMQATAMLLGIYADTGSLTLMGTTDRDARAAAYLLSRGANLRVMSRLLQSALNRDQHALLQQLQTHTRWIQVNGARIRLLSGETPDYVGGLSLVVHRLQELTPAPALFAAVKMLDRVHLVGRSEVPWVNAGDVLSAFGGGGHASAASAVVKGAEARAVLDGLEGVLQEKVSPPPAARDIMSSPVKAIASDKPAREAERLMLRYGHTGLPVVDQAGGLQGIVSLRDVEKARRHGLMHAPVKGLMVRRVVTVSPETPLDEIQALMIEKDIGRVPVVADGNLVGIISRSDLLGMLYGGPAPRWHRTLYAGGGQARLPEEDDGAPPAFREGLAAIPPEVMDLLCAAGTVAEQVGVPVFAVGGFVRDMLMQRPNLDLDLVVEGDGLLFARALGHALSARVVEVPRFGTAHLYLPSPTEGRPDRIDVATARREYYEHAAALPLVEHADLREDLYRRDFSINAMAARLGPEGPTGLLDFFGGLHDLEAGQIRVLHTLSFVEDPTRILRAVRFARRYGFALDPETYDLARRATQEGFLRRVSMERLRHELVLILQERFSGGALALLADLGVLSELLPGVTIDDEARELLDRVDIAEREARWLGIEAEAWLVKLIALLARLPEEGGIAAAQRLKLRREATQAALHALEHWRDAVALLAAPEADPGTMVSVLREMPPEGLVLLHLLGGAGPVRRYWLQWRNVKLSITGKDLLAAGVPAGPSVRRVLDRVLADRLAGRAPDRDSQLSLAVRYAEEEA